MPYVDTLPAKSAIFDHWKDRLREVGLFCDWGEPSCWACRFHYGTKYDIRNPDASMAEILAGWDRIPLQRCHIVPRSLGGSDEVGNLFLMCRECHDLAPNTDIPEIFLEWARAQCATRREAARIDEAMKAFGIEDSDQEAMTQLMFSPEFRKWSEGRRGLHRPQSNYPYVSSRLTLATVVGLAAHFSRVFPETAQEIISRGWSDYKLPPRWAR